MQASSRHSSLAGLLLFATLPFAAPAFADDQDLLDRFRKYNRCGTFTCLENRTDSYANREHNLRGVMASVCNEGPHDVVLKIRRKKVSNWGTVKERTVKPNQCRIIKYELSNVLRRDFELKVNNDGGSTYHLMRYFKDNVLPDHDLFWAIYPEDSTY